MKRVVAIVIFMAMVTTLFAFSVYAETPVQPLQVVTYSDTSTNVRISGTAERLHYNIDSFQVVFMSPPNNYGTSCTPVLVSFRFYNASETPAYVGQAEFELTATSGTGSVNTIIYGYDQISTDLFVAESSYSTAEVGRIGIGASNDFAYYTGFVIPPRTSLYFSCIVYVNASAFAQNNTGATEDVNQITLSALNFYNNQISFSADYPYHNQPVDFTGIINEIQNLSNTVSTSSEMQSLISALTYTGNPYNIVVSNSNYSQIISNQYLDANNKMFVNLFRYIGSPYYINNDIELDSANDQIIHTGTKCVHVRYILELTNNNTLTAKLWESSRLVYLLPTNNNVNCVISMQSDIYSNVRDVSNTLAYLVFKNRYGSYAYVPRGVHWTYIDIDIYFDDSINLTFNNTAFAQQYGPVFEDGYYPVDEYHILRDLYFSLVKPGNQDNTEEAQDMNDQIHQQEQVWYENNSEALEQVGLSNYRFSTSQSSGITQAVTQFQAVWNALGDWTNVYIFILILSISTYIIRHEPTTRVKQYRSSVQAERAERISYYSRKNAESRASNSTTLKSVIRRRK